MGNYFYQNNWMYNMMFGYGNGLSIITWLMPLIIFDLIAKGFALWKAARNHSPIWFVALLITNSMGILPLIYLAFFEKKKK